MSRGGKGIVVRSVGFAAVTVVLLFAAVSCVPGGTGTVTTQSSLMALAACQDGTQASGARYRICMPISWNGDLVVYAHGYVAASEPIAIPENRLRLPDGTSIPDQVTMFGFAFATTSYSVNGLAIKQGLADLVDLVSIFRNQHPNLNNVYLAGVSEGGLITALAIEKYPNVFSGGLAACGPIGDFQG